MDTISLSKTFREFKAPETKRKVIQLTHEKAHCYPLYYFIPSIAGKYLVFHRCDTNELQLCRLDLSTGEVKQLTHGGATQTAWWPWDCNSKPGILDHRSVLNEKSCEAIYFIDNEVHAVNLENLSDRILFSLSPDRICHGQSCVSQDGQWFIYISHERESYENRYKRWLENNKTRADVKDTHLCAFNLITGEQRVLIVHNAFFHHVHPYGRDQIVFSSLPTGASILITDYYGGWYKHVRTPDTEGGGTGHYCATSRGITYEVLRHKRGNLGGMIRPESNKRLEFVLPSKGYMHVGFDPEGLLWFYEENNANISQMRLLAEYKDFENTEWLQLTGEWKMFASGQKAHHHPRITPDRKYILFTAGDELTQTNQIFLLDINDLADHISLPMDLLS